MREFLRISVLLAAVVCAGAAQAQSKRLNRPSGLDTRDQSALFSERFQLIYQGRFDEIRATYQFDETLRDMFVHSALAWSTVCSAYLAPDSPTFPVTASTVNGYGTVVQSNTRHQKIDTRFAEKIRQYGMSYSNWSWYQTLFERNGCQSAASQQYLDNLLRLAYGKPSVQQSRANPR